ncbi:MAG: DUF4402 domain-containing protein [bacterium]|nr:DUF4402 domain-containing protein [bacterium]
MKINKICLYIVILAVGISSTQIYAASINGSASAVINAKIGISETTAMNFGIIAVDATGGTVVLTNQGAISGPLSYELTGTKSKGVLSISSTPGQSLTITYTNGTLTGPGPDMALNVTGITNTNTASLTSSGTDPLDVGAELVVGATQTVGSYTGTYTVEVNY